MEEREYRPRLSEEEYNIVREFRALRDEVDNSSMAIDHGWIKSKTKSIHFKIDHSQDLEKMIGSHIEKIKEYSPYLAEMKKEHEKDEHILILNPADVHIGKLCEIRETGSRYDHDIAVEQMKSGIISLYDRAKEGYNVNQVIFVGGNDMLHIDNPFRKTTSGTSQDTTGSWWSNYELAWKTCADLISTISNETKVHFVHAPSNHDYMSGYHLAQTVSAYFHNNQNVTCDVSNAHRKYVSYGSCLFGFTHGDGAKESDLPNLMAMEAQTAWASSDHKQWMCGHLHHKIKKDFHKKKGEQVEKDYMDVTVIQTGVSEQPKDKVRVEYLRSPSGTDAWHDRNGYKSKKALEAFVFHAVLGERARLVEFF